MNEIWKDVNEYEGLYKISNLGNVYSTKKKDLKSKILSKRGYYVVDLWNNGKRKNLKIHRLIAIHFIDNPHKKTCINHKNGIKTDNSIQNLEWCSKLENNRHARINKLNPDYGDTHHNSKLKESDVLFIRSNTHLKNKDIANMFNIGPSYVSKIKKRKVWRHLP